MSTERQVLPFPPRPALTTTQERLLITLYAADGVLGKLYLHTETLQHGNVAATIRSLVRLGMLEYAPVIGGKPIVLTDAGRARAFAEVGERPPSIGSRGTRGMRRAR